MLRVEVCDICGGDHKCFDDWSEWAAFTQKHFFQVMRNFNKSLSNQDIEALGNIIRISVRPVGTTLSFEVAKGHRAAMRRAVEEAVLENFGNPVMLVTLDNLQSRHIVCGYFAPEDAIQDNSLALDLTCRVSKEFIEQLLRFED